ncbi:MAG TPA: sugar-binding protein, partial [Phycisphaerae bacterium]|nr:sugar-binding protein [Phycisphaerae bacterium]
MTSITVPWLVVVLCAAAGAGLAAQEPPVYDIPRMDKVAIDGKTDDWADKGFRIDLLAPLTGPMKPAADLDARIRLGWNDRGLLVLAAVQDDKWVEHPDKNMLWCYDVIELYLAPQRGAADLCQWVITPGMDPKQPKLRWHLHDHRKEEKLKKLPAGITAARTKTANGYVLEALLPWAALAIAPKLGREVGFQVFVTDTDEVGKTQSYIATWYPGVGVIH